MSEEPQGVLPRECELALEGAVADLRGLFDTDLLSVVLFGSGARGDFDPKRSDLNLLVVLKQADFARLKRIVPTLKSWRKRRISTPLVMDPAYIQTAQDVFPLEFLEMRWAHRVLHGPDPLAAIEPPREALRRQCEQEARGKLLHLRKILLETDLDSKRLMDAVRLAAPAFVRIGRTHLYLKFSKVSLQADEVLKGLEQDLGLPLQGLASAWGSRSRVSGQGADADKLFAELLADVEALVAAVDSLHTS
ncbi:MAG: nucleotidyltransferase domain-containing protein [Nitrospirae bacterium]|nr:nucleotidyltransferase domain-containing protein [Nitrospirota bacterium]